MVWRFSLLLGWVASAASAAGSADADALWANGDYRAAFAQAFEPASHGNAHAQYLLGEAYRLGRSVNADMNMAEQWYLRAARQGDVAAATELGLLYASQHRDREAMPWLSLAALQDDPRATCTLAALYFNGDGVDRNAVLAYALMARAASSGLMEARVRLVTLRYAMKLEDQAQGETMALGGWDGWLRPAAVTRETQTPYQQVPTQLRHAVDQHVADVRAGNRPRSAMVAARTPANIRIQVGAYGTQRAARSAWIKLSRTIGDAAWTDHDIVRAGNIYRVQARLGDAESARKFRRKLDLAGWSYLMRANPVRST